MVKNKKMINIFQYWFKEIIQKIVIFRIEITILDLKTIVIVNKQT